jgi:hypothetical protein
MANDRPFDTMYFDSNILLANHWPEPLPELSNTLELARWWKITACFPAAVLDEVESHWHRELQDGVAALRSSRGRLLKAARPINIGVPDVDVDLAELQRRYAEMAADAIRHFDIQVVDFTKRSTQEMFGYATRYVRPFAPKGEGKGFQDAVIAISVLDHLEGCSGATAVLISKDGDLANVNYQIFLPTFEQKRLRVIDLTTAFDELFYPYFDETRVKPYERLLADAQQLARADANKLREFVASRLTPDMLRTQIGDRILQIVAVDSLDLRSVQVPFPENDTITNVDISIKVTATCKVRVLTDLAALRGLFGGLSLSTEPNTREQESKLIWFGLIEARGTVVDGTLQEITPQFLTADEI